MFFIRTLDQFGCLCCLQRWRLKSQMQPSTISWTDRRAGKNKHTSMFKHTFKAKVSLKKIILLFHITLSFQQSSRLKGGDP